MAYTEQRRIIKRTLQANFYVPHPWDDWLTKQYPESPPPPKIKNIQGKIIGPMTIDRGNSTWNIKDLTLACAACPLYIPPNEATKVSKHLRSQRETWMPEDQQGLCAYRTYRPKYLVPRDKLSQCSIGEKKRQLAIRDMERLIALRKELGKPHEM